MKNINIAELLFRTLIVVLLTAALLISYVNYPRTPATVIEFKTTKNQYVIGEELKISSVMVYHRDASFESTITIRCANGAVSYSILDVKKLAVSQSNTPIVTGEVTIGTVPYEIATVIKPTDGKIECRVVATTEYTINLLFNLKRTETKVDVTPFFIVVKE